MVKMAEEWQGKTFDLPIVKYTIRYMFVRSMFLAHKDNY